MLTEAFLMVLEDAEPGCRVTGIATWEMPARPGGPDVIARTAQMKAPVLDAVEMCSGARINPLAGTRQAILDVPVEGWRELLRSRNALFAGDDLRIEPNVAAFSTLPEPR